MISKKTLITRAKRLTFSKMWMNHCDNLESTLSNMLDKIVQDENSFILAFQRCRNINLRYVMRDVLYLVYETNINSYKHLAWAPWMEARYLVSTRNADLENGEDSETTLVRKLEYLDYGDLDQKALGKRDIFQVQDHHGAIHYGFLMILFTEAMELFDPDLGIPFVKFMQTRYKHADASYAEFKQKQEKANLVFESFEELKNDCEALESKTEVREAEIQYLVDKLVRFRDKIDECIDYFKDTKSKVDLKNMLKIKELIELYTKQECLNRDGEKRLRKLTAKQIQRLLGGVNKRGVFKPMDNDRFKKLVGETKKMWDVLAIRIAELEATMRKRHIVHYGEILAEIRGHFTPEFVRSEWLHEVNETLHTIITQH